ncbi:MAG: bifunctional 2-polyprenyl-6-hydroxyphenol methylase/3-demethylubiquinol 3-O-methyltransferase UbiG [Gammaproteobacteria bacterium]|nr:bifunctional 2-polyprenyl-6-hydroxyphenol methylase/3-demethylubiquinol 3-O-methyltransferase UbiG [Gammaproteobacteria bacterium]NND40367.1 bifunctional 2-polyprenyl-6-hydroxyphenol methylase/3-demethylubiquinol 3-O-methyltransferase UbiG [Pseudomonadales bacterium]MBT8151083.1 bifunctional 2-polyprenyl-6-hydroxyphenol methylase/3-demethylubiquinol 3-O-methyltransferase UbiG [Gammaproteobacteria bacterium]NNL11964.1 bifunctional 2-polyprenyl-6-hydroxyphenol methylase/3-demethylubiquinol 3-O-
MSENTNPDTNVDPAELEKFSALAERWWDPDSEFKPLHEINPLRSDYIDKYAQVAGKQLVDIGCGGGLLSEAMAQRGAKVSAIDMAETPLQIARQHAVQSGLDIEYMQRSAEDLASERAGQYDVVTCLEMLEHVPDPASVVNACARLLKPGGHAFFATLNRNPKSYLFAIIGAEHVLNLLPKGTHEYEKFIKPSELDSWMRAAELRLAHSTGMVYNPFSQRYRLDPKDLSVNYLLHAVAGE